MTPEPEESSPFRASALPFPLALLCIAISAAALYFAQPGAGGPGWLAWVALAPFLAAIQGRSPGAAFGMGYLWGFLYNLLILIWLRPFGPPAWVGLTVVQAFSPALFALFASRTLRRGGAAAVWGTAALWTLSEQLRAFISFGLSWGDLSYTQAGFLPALHTVSWWGAVGLSFLVALANAAVWALVSPSPPTPGGRGVAEGRDGGNTFRWRQLAKVAPLSALAFLLLALLMGAVGLHRKQQALAAAPRPVKIGLVQANVSRTMDGLYLNPEAAFRAYEALTDDLARQGCRWVLWPESATPSEIWDKATRLSQIARRNRIYLLAGGFDEPDWNRTYNAVFVFGPDGRLLDTYHKRRIVPFGEFVPWRRYLPPLDRFGVPATDLTPGAGKGVVEAGTLKIGLAICFESLFSGLALVQRRDGVDLLAVATNDSYYGYTPAAAFHAASLRLRAVETGLPAVQAATTGYSLAVLPDGRVMDRSELFQRAALVVDLPPPVPAGLWVAAPWLIWGILLGMAIYGLSPYRRR